MDSERTVADPEYVQTVDKLVDGTITFAGRLFRTLGALLTPRRAANNLRSGDHRLLRPRTFLVLTCFVAIVSSRFAVIIFQYLGRTLFGPELTRADLRHFSAYLGSFSPVYAAISSLPVVLITIAVSHVVNRLSAHPKAKVVATVVEYSCGFQFLCTAATSIVLAPIVLMILMAGGSMVLVLLPLLVLVSWPMWVLHVCAPEPSRLRGFRRSLVALLGFIVSGALPTLAGFAYIRGQDVINSLRSDLFAGTDHPACTLERLFSVHDSTFLDAVFSLSNDTPGMAVPINKLLTWMTPQDKAIPDEPMYDDSYSQVVLVGGTDGAGPYLIVPPGTAKWARFLIRSPRRSDAPITITLWDRVPVFVGSLFFRPAPLCEGTLHGEEVSPVDVQP